MWDRPGPGLEPMPTALAGGFLTTAPPGKPSMGYFLKSKTVAKNKEYVECWTAKEEMRVIKTVKSLLEGTK